MAYWSEKLAGNKTRDQRKTDELKRAGWRVETVWQCELSDLSVLASRLTGLLGPVKKNATNAERRDKTK